MNQYPPRFRLSIWKPAEFGRPLHYSCRINEHEKIAPSPIREHSSFALENLNEQIYVWTPNEDIWAGFSSSANSEELKNLLMVMFDPSLPCSTRGLEKLESIIHKLKFHIDAGSILWMDCQEQIPQKDLEPVSHRMSPVLALFLHFSWIFETFRHVSGASITVR